MESLLNINNISVAKALLVFYFISASHNSPLLSKQMKEFISQNRIAQHLIGFIMMMVIVHIIGGTQEVGKLIYYTVITYLWFILTTKLELQWNLAIVLLLLVWFLYENRLNLGQEIMILKDKILDKNAQTKVITTNNKYKSMTVAFLILLTTMGVVFYSRKKTVQYGGGFNPMKFLFY